jgi:hypothetical protein
MTASSFSGHFSAISLGYSVQQQGNNLVLFYGSPLLAGDYDGNGVVDARDYVVWRQTLATGGTLMNETASPGVTDQADYDAWRANFGATSASGSGGFVGTNAIPEPQTNLLFVFAIGLAYSAKPCRRRRIGPLRVFGSFLQR